MSIKKEISIQLDVLKGFFHIKHNLWIIISSILLSVGIYAYYFFIPDVCVFPQTQDFTFNTYSDVDLGGNSEITEFTVHDTVINFDFILRDAIPTRYVGINVSPKHSKKIDLSHYNELSIQLDSKGIKNISFTLFTPNTNKKKNQISDIFFSKNIEYHENIKEYIVDFDELEVPNWWLDLNEISLDKKINPDLKNVLSFNISNGYSPNINSENSIRIYSIVFSRDNKPLLFLLLIIECVIIMLLFIFHVITFSKSKKVIPITIEYKAIDTENENKQLHSFVDYINTNFHECELTLEQVSVETGINHRRIATYIQQRYGCNFKTYVNQLRINESKRLLKETELHIGEVAFKVGFNNQSHFNRVFKSIVELSPSEFRENKI